MKATLGIWALALAWGGPQAAQEKPVKVLGERPQAERKVFRESVRVEVG